MVGLFWEVWGSPRGVGWEEYLQWREDEVRRGEAGAVRGPGAQDTKVPLML